MKTLIYFCFLSLIFVTCIEKRITRLDRKAIERVEAKRSLLDQVFYEGLKLHPCANDEIIILKRDTIITFVIDSIVSETSDTVRIYDKRTITLVDSVKVKVVDHQLVDILTDSLNNCKKQLSFKDGQIIEKDKQAKQDKREKRNLWITISGLITLVVCLNGLWFYLKLRKII